MPFALNITETQNQGGSRSTDRVREAGNRGLISRRRLAGALITEYGNKHQRGLDIEKGEVIRVVLMQTPGTESHNRLLMVIHHLAVDGVSWRILLEDLEGLLTALMQGEPPMAGNKSSSYRQWYEALQQYGQSRRLLSQKPYWQQVVNSYAPLGVDKQYRQEVKVKDMGQHSTGLSAEAGINPGSAPRLSYRDQ